MELYVNNEKWCFSKHALHRIKKRKITEDELEEAIKNPKRISPVIDDRGKRKYALYTKSRLNIIFVKASNGNHIVITAYKATKEFSKQKRSRQYIKQQKKKFGGKNDTSREVKKMGTKREKRRSNLL